MPENMDNEIEKMFDDSKKCPINIVLNFIQTKTDFIKDLYGLCPHNTSDEKMMKFKESLEKSALNTFTQIDYILANLLEEGDDDEIEDDDGLI